MSIDQSEFACLLQVEISFRPEHGFMISLGFTPTLPTKPSDVTALPGSTEGSPIDVDSNPHLIIRQHLEELLNATNSVNTLMKVSCKIAQIFTSRN